MIFDTCHNKRSLEFEDMGSIAKLSLMLLILIGLGNGNYLILQNSVCLCVCVGVCMSVRNRLPNHAHYGDENYKGDSMGLG